MNRAYSRLLPLTLAMLLIGNAHADVSSPSQATPSGTYRTALGGLQFTGSHLETTSNGYTVESGNLMGKDGVAGGMVVVRSPDGAVTAFIEREDGRGILQVDTEGKRTFSQDVDQVFPRNHEIDQPVQNSNSVDAYAPDNMNYIDALVGFTAKALAAREVDPMAFALGQMEWVNLSLRNSKVANIELRLAGIRITDEDIPVTTAGLANWQRQLNAQRPHYRHDINVGFSVGGDAGGWAYRPGNSSVNSIHGTSPFKHEMGHNVGGGHCYPNAGDNYKHGYNGGGGFTTNLCGNSRPYYSTPDVTVNGSVIGNAKTANMARLWREQAHRLSSYSPAFEGARLIYVSSQDQARLTVAPAQARLRVGVVARSSDVGPTSLTYGGAGITTLTVKLTDSRGVERPVKLRAQRQVPGCPGQATTMNSYVVCHPVNGGAQFMLSYEKSDNPELPSGWYNGTVELEARNIDDKNWSLPILVSLAVRS
ncbi:hypothetical protein [Pseudomonas alkylphenolica]|uniref:hypothetical protein n=1 Tax=Pseudomonas alkylphenolica TaxID=237609 RepID=UPI0018D85B26|nr:hypothetical protein [Pseudomonas alkylphenolica]MBH3427572.1 hypothetical protein [Pseudomonas alkylphenolica]